MIQEYSQKIPTVSIVTVVYNDVKHIAKTMDSVYKQTYTNYEYIIIDGNSTDGTQEEIQKNIKEGTIYISEPDKGVYDAMNKATHIASGEWIYFLNSQDSFFAIDTLEKIFSEQHEANIGCIIGNIRNVKTIGKVKLFLDEKPQCLKHSPIFVLPGCHQAIFTRTWLQKKYFFDTIYKICADFNFFKTIFEKESINFHYVNCIIATYDLSGLSAKNVLLATKETAKIRGQRYPKLWNCFKIVTLGILKRLFMLLPSKITRRVIVNRLTKKGWIQL